LAYFGRDRDAALQRWLDEKDDLLAGRVPRVRNDGLTVRDLANHFLTAKINRRDAGEIAPRTFDEYKASCARVVERFGKTRLVNDLTSSDFEALRANLAKTRGPVALGNEVQRVRMLFKFAYDEHLIESPVRHGQGFRKPSKNVMRQARAAKGKRLLPADKVRAAIDCASPQLRAMLLLGFNCGFGNGDCANLPLESLDLESGWVDFPRPKTGIDRRCPLWPQTVVAIREAIAARPQPTDPAHARLVFITKYGRPWKPSASGCPISAECRKLFRSVGLDRGSFYWARHQFCTVGAGGGDRDAVEFIMGHVAQDDDMHAVYREEMLDDRLAQVVDRVRQWLFSDLGPTST